MQNKETKKTELVHKQNNYLPFAIITFLLVAALVLFGWFLFREYSTINTATARIGKETFKLEVADTDAARIQGLSERDNLAPGTGMLFVFNTDGNWRMVMRQMRFPIDIAWLDASKSIVHIKHNATPAEYPEEYKADRPTRYVIEVPSGTFNRLGVQEGDSISF